MIIRVNLYKVSSGKWAYGEIVDIGNTKPWNREEFVQAIIDNQTFVIPGTLESGAYYVTTDNTDDSDPFAMGLYFPDEFRR